MTKPTYEQLAGVVEIFQTYGRSPVLKELRELSDAQDTIEKAPNGAVEQPYSSDHILASIWTKTSLEEKIELLSHEEDLDKLYDHARNKQIERDLAAHGIKVEFPTP
jgi:hypothetical protein